MGVGISRFSWPYLKIVTPK